MGKLTDDLITLITRAMAEPVSYRVNSDGETIRTNHPVKFTVMPLTSTRPAA